MRDPLQDVMKERARQDEKWGEQNHDDAAWMMILAEEVGEAAQIVLAAAAPGDPYRPILDQLVRVGLRAQAAIGQACELSYSQPTNNAAVHAESVQITAVGLAWLECMERREAAAREGSGKHGAL